MTHNSEPAGSGIASAEYHSHLITRESFIVSHRSLLTIWLIYSLNLVELLGGAIVLERHLLWFIVYESLNRLFISLPVLWVHFNKNIIYVTQLGVHSKLDIVFQCVGFDPVMRRWLYLQVKADLNFQPFSILNSFFSYSRFSIKIFWKSSGETQWLLSSKLRFGPIRNLEQL